MQIQLASVKKNLKIEGLMHICGKYQIWCHIEGDNLPCLGTIGIPKKLAPVMACNSITLVRPSAILYFTSDK